MITKILIIDDSRVSRSIIKKCIPDGCGYEIYEAEDGRMGLEKFKEIKPDLTFLDLTMPVMDGFQCLEEIRKVDKNAIVVVITADIQKKSMEKVKDLGAFTTLKKPTSKEDVQEVLLHIQKMTE